MFRNDYVMRMVEQFTNALGALLRLKKQLKPQEAMNFLGETYKRLFGLHPNVAKALSERDLVELLRREGEATREKLLILGKLLQEEADLSDMLDRHSESHRLRLKSLHVMLSAASEPQTEQWLDVPGEVDRLLEQLEGYTLPMTTKQLLWTYYGTANAFAKAEDVLFELLEQFKDRDEGSREAYGALLEEAVAYYEQLLTLDSETLEAGRLPMDEVQESLDEIKEQLRLFRNARPDEQ